MSARVIEDTPTSPYAVLGVSRYATTEQIKHAYRHKAKLAHPDAGGSVAAMAKVNEAYHTLSDPGRRHTYDMVHGSEEVMRPTTSRPAHRSQPQPTPPRPAEPRRAQPKAEPQYAEPHQDPTEGFRHDAAERREREEAAAHAEAAHINRERAAWARTSALELFRVCAPLTLGAILAQRFAIGRVDGAFPQFSLDFFSFLPVYGLILSMIFMADPPLRLVFADLARHHPTDKADRVNAVAVVLSFFPLLAVWLLLSNSFR
jgi:curved DNA-binding protein CbpA